MRILLVSEKFAPEIGGACAVAEALARNLPANITVIAPKPRVAHSSRSDEWEITDPQPNPYPYDRRFPFPVHRVPALLDELPQTLPRRLRGALQFAVNALWTRPRATASILRYLRTHPADILCINTLSCYWLPAALNRHHPNLRTVFYLHGEEIAGGPATRRLDRLAHAALRAADAVVTVSSFTRQLALACGVLSARITVLHNGVDTERFTPGPPDPAIQQRFGLHDKKVLLCLARLDERKGQDRLLQAMPAILAAVPDAVLLLVGGGADEPRLRALAADLSLGDCVHFAGVATEVEVALYYRSADVYIMPNRTTDSGDTEGFGLVFLEAGACAKPVIGGRAGGVPDAILHEQTGLLVDGRSVEEIAAAAIRLLSDPTYAAELGRNGLAHARAHTWAAQAAKFLALCKSLRSYPKTSQTPHVGR